MFTISDEEDSSRIIQLIIVGVVVGILVAVIIVLVYIIYKLRRDTSDTKASKD